MPIAIARPMSPMLIVSSWSIVERALSSLIRRVSCSTDRAKIVGSVTGIVGVIPDSEFCNFL